MVKHETITFVGGRLNGVIIEAANPKNVFLFPYTGNTFLFHNKTEIPHDDRLIFVCVYRRRMDSHLFDGGEICLN